MTEKYLNKYRIESTRLPFWNYRSPGYYFITLCTKNRECFFGDVVDGKMILSATGKIAEEIWNEIPKHFRHVELDVSVIMPNHLHGIIVIICGLDNRKDAVLPRLNNPRLNVPRLYRLPNPGSLSAIIGSFKSVATKQIRSTGCKNFCWQSRFYDHIIRDEQSLNRIREYIINNPIKWEMDRNNPKNY